MTEHPNLASALVAALADLCVVEKGRTAKIPGKEGKQGYSYDYADLSDVVKDSRPVLAEHGVVALTPLGMAGNDLAVTVIFLHASGDRMDLGPFPFPHGRDAQATGSMVTYHRRYALCAALGIAAGDDDDGATAAPRQREEAAPAKPVREPMPGFASLEDEKTAHDELQAAVKAQPVDVRAAVKDYQQSQNYPWPMGESELDDMREFLDALSQGVGGDASTREGDGSGGTTVAASAATEALAVSPDVRRKRAEQVAMENGLSLEDRAAAMAENAKDGEPDDKKKVAAGERS